MTKFKIHNGLLAVTALALSLTLSGCNKYLDKVPDDRTQLDNVQTIKELLTSGYPVRSYIKMYELRSDNATDKGIRAWDMDREGREMYTFQAKVSSTYQDTPDGYWANLYECFSVANQALRSLEELGGLSTDEKRLADEAKGEALIIRAYSGYMLAQTFARPYDPETAATFLGIPYPTEPEDVVIKEYSRGSLKETYDKIVKDFEEGYALIGSTYSQPKYHWTKTSAAAFGSALYRTLGDWKKVIAYANAALGADPTVFLRPLKDYTPLTYAEKAKRYTEPTENTNLIIDVAMSWWRNASVDSRFGLTPNLLQETSYKGRLNFLGVDVGIPQYGGDFYANLAKWHQYFQVNNVQAQTGFGYIAVPLFTAEHVLMNLSEAYAMLEQYDKANSTLRDFVSKFFVNFSPTDQRYMVTTDKITKFYSSDTRVFKPFYPLNETQTAYAKAYADLRRVLFIQEGLRWLDIRHYNLPVKHVLQSANDSKSEEVTLEAGDPRYAFQVPSSVLGYNIEPNPGYEKSDLSLLEKAN